MAEIVTLSQRRTHKYVGTYAYLDKWRDVVEVKLVRGRKISALTDLAQRMGVRHGRNMDQVWNRLDASDGPAYVHKVVAPRGWTDHKALIRALEDTYSRHGCHHEYDCCGCASYSAEARHIRGREYSLRIDVGYNY